MQFNPLMILNRIRNGENPQQIMMSYIQSSIGNTPMGANLIELIKNNKTDEIEKIARNLAKEKGINFNDGLIAFKQDLGL